jgi:hypothetical protein
MSIREVKAWQCGCDRCGHVWMPKDNAVPRMCPRCKSVKWDDGGADKVPFEAKTLVEVLGDSGVPKEKRFNTVMEVKSVAPNVSSGSGKAVVLTEEREVVYDDDFGS